jgi:tetratricopeptide (TPR) repeat protein
MKQLLLSIGIAILSLHCFSQLNTSIYTQGVCECMDSSGGVDKAMIDCFAKSIDKNAALFNQTLRERGDTSQRAISVLYEKLLFKVQIDLIGFCTSFFQYTDSLHRMREKNLNRDSLEREVKELNNLDANKIGKAYYLIKGNLFVQLGELNNALIIADSLLSKDSTGEVGLYLKALVFDKKRDYEHSSQLYGKLAETTKKDIYLLYGALATRRRQEEKKISQ